jgi:uncharacterized protein (TIGR03435 family)
LLLLNAYNVSHHQVRLSDWMNETYYSVEAKIPPGATAQQVHLMQQALLTERLRMTTHLERKELPVYEMTVDKNGSKLSTVRPIYRDGPSGTLRNLPQQPGMPLRHHGYETMESLALYLSRYSDRPVIDGTGLAGKYDMALSFVFAPVVRGPASAALPEMLEGPRSDLIDAVQMQLGLKLTPTKRTLDVLIIDDIRKVPIDN